jgi:hypothetical protein
MKKTLLGIVLFLMQISLAIFYNATIDLIIIGIIGLLTFAYILVRYFRKDYETCEL